MSSTMGAPFFGIKTEQTPMNDKDQHVTTKKHPLRSSYSCLGSQPLPCNIFRLKPGVGPLQELQLFTQPPCSWEASVGILMNVVVGRCWMLDELVAKMDSSFRFFLTCDVTRPPQRLEILLQSAADGKRHPPRPGRWFHSNNRTGKYNQHEIHGLVWHGSMIATQS